MRTNIVIDDKLMAEAMKATGARTKREAVELGLQALVQLRRQQGIRAWRGKLRWTGDLQRMRAGG
jgi:Arc/MetJ family transcription regulator